MTIHIKVFERGLTETIWVKECFCGFFSVTKNLHAQNHVSFQSNVESVLTQIFHYFSKYDSVHRCLYFHITFE